MTKPVPRRRLKNLRVTPIRERHDNDRGSIADGQDRALPQGISGSRFRGLWEGRGRTRSSGQRRPTGTHPTALALGAFRRMPSACRT